MSFYVYIHKNVVNNKRYVGITTSAPKNRWRNNGNGYKQQEHFYRSIQKYGWNNFEHQVFEVETKSEMYYLEKYLISYYNTTNPDKGYNKSLGGESGNFQGKDSYSKEYAYMTRQKHKEYNKEYNRQYLDKNKEKLKEQSKVYYQEHKDEILNRTKLYRETHKEEIAERKRIYAETHKEHLREYHRQWKQNNKNKYITI